MSLESRGGEEREFSVSSAAASAPYTSH